MGGNEKEGPLTVLNSTICALMVSGIVFSWTAAMAMMLERPNTNSSDGSACIHPYKLKVFTIRYANANMQHLILE